MASKNFLVMLEVHCNIFTLDVNTIVCPSKTTWRVPKKKKTHNQIRAIRILGDHTAVCAEENHETQSIKTEQPKDKNSWLNQLGKINTIHPVNHKLQQPKPVLPSTKRDQHSTSSQSEWEGQLDFNSQKK